MNQFTFDFTVTDLDRLLNRRNSRVREWYDSLCHFLPQYDIHTPERVAAFIAQCGHESADFTRTEENLNYSAESLMRVFPRYFPDMKKALQYERRPTDIANYIYMDEYRTKRGALGNTEPGDGWRFRGRGLIQLTGRWNYEKLGKSFDNMPAEKVAEYLETVDGAVESACWFWEQNRCNQFADEEDIQGLTLRINGGIHGLDDRKTRWYQAIYLFTNKRNSYMVGDRGYAVQQIQLKLGVASDGIFGPRTESAVKAVQEKHGIEPDGIVDKKLMEILRVDI